MIDLSDQEDIPVKAMTNANRVIFTGLALLGVCQICIAGEAECFHQLIPGWGKPVTAMQPMLNDVKLDGIAKGGELLLLEMINPNPRYIRIETHPGETAETVIARMAAAVNELNPFHPDHARTQHRNEKGEIVAGPPPKRAEGNLLKSFGGYPGDYICAGTETGLGIPPPPTSLSVSYDAERQEVTLHWENPAEAYDAIGGSVGPEAGTATTAVRRSRPPDKRLIRPNIIDRAGFRANKGLRRFDVIGCRGGVLSNAAVITLNYEDSSQEELDTQPFTAGICPNWKAWSSGGEAGMLILEQGTKGEWKRFDQEPRAPVEREDKQYFQWIKTRSPSVTGGVCRKFLGLHGGHTYRLYTRMNTFEMGRVQENWSFSFHAVPHGKAVTLSSEQMAGTAPLPDGSAGLLAGQVAAYGPGSTTEGKFVECSTEKPGPNSPVLDITLPPGAEVITVWFRYSGAARSGVGFDWIKLKDITTK